MKGIATSDLHLGFRAFAATECGRNARELDVERAWGRVVDNIIAQQPDLVTVAGDVFHHPRPSMFAVKAWRDGVRRIVADTDAWVVAVVGNHDAGRTAEALSPVVIPDDLEQFHVATSPERFHLETYTGFSVAVACFPFVSLGAEQAYRLAPDRSADINVLLVHAAVKASPNGEMLPFFYGGAGALDISSGAEQFDLVAVGDFHEYRRLHPRELAFYSGAIERTTCNIWQEQLPKGVIAYDVLSREWELIPHETRPVFDLNAADFPDVDEPNLVLAAIAESPLYKDAIVRLVFREFPRAERELIDWSLVRELKSRCLHFQLDLQWAERSSRLAVREAPVTAARPLEDDAADFFRADAPAVRDCAFGYLGLDIPGGTAGEPRAEEARRRGLGQPPPAEVAAR